MCCRARRPPSHALSRTRRVATTLLASSAMALLLTVMVARCSPFGSSDEPATDFDAAIDATTTANDAALPIRDAGDAATGRRLFVSSEKLTGMLGGNVGADQACTALAVDAGLGGAWVAWLSADRYPSVTNAVDLLPEDAWYDVKGEALVFSATSDIRAGGSPKAPIGVTERGTALAKGELYWTGTSPRGTVMVSSDCYDWRTNDGGRVGLVGATGELSAKWTSAASISCDERSRLLCFER